MRQKMHQFVIHELGPLLYDQRVGEADLRRQVDEQLHRALSQERLALTGVRNASSSCSPSPTTCSGTDRSTNCSARTTSRK